MRTLPCPQHKDKDWAPGAVNLDVHVRGVVRGPMLDGSPGCGGVKLHVGDDLEVVLLLGRGEGYLFSHEMATGGFMVGRGACLPPLTAAWVPQWVLGLPSHANTSHPSPPCRALQGIKHSVCGEPSFSWFFDGVLTGASSLGSWVPQDAVPHAPAVPMTPQQMAGAMAFLWGLEATRCLHRECGIPIPACSLAPAHHSGACSHPHALL
jgi:hypothetical protein